MALFKSADMFQPVGFDGPRLSSVLLLGSLDRPGFALSAMALQSGRIVAVCPRNLLGQHVMMMVVLYMTYSQTDVYL
jgi:hypothetical protein